MTHQTEIHMGHTVSLNDLECLTCDGGNYAGLRDHRLACALSKAFASTRRGYVATGFYVLDTAGNRALLTALGYSPAQQARYISGRDC